MHWRRLIEKYAGLVRASAVCLAMAAGSLFGADIVVSGTCSLPDAIKAANTDAPAGGCPAGLGADVISLTNDIELIAVDNDGAVSPFDVGAMGLPIVISPITIEGNGYEIRRNVASPPFRILAVIAGFTFNGDLTLRNLSLRGGRTQDLLVADCSFVTGLTCGGGGLLVFRAPATLEGVTFSGNQALRGGALENRAGLVTARDSRFEGNFAEFGGGIYNVTFNTPGFLALHRAEILSNTATRLDPPAAVGSGGGIFNENGTLTIAESLIDSNRSDEFAGAMYTVGALSNVTLVNTLVRNNTAKSVGGIANTNAADLTVINSQFFQNSDEAIGSIDHAGAISNSNNGDMWIVDGVFEANQSNRIFGGGGAISNGGNLGGTPNAAIWSSDFRQNVAAWDGGAIASTAGITEVVNSEIDANEAGNHGGAIFVESGIAAEPGNLRVVASTLSNNLAGRDGGGIFGARSAVITPQQEQFEFIGTSILANTAGDEGGGIRAESRFTRIISSTIANNTSNAFGAVGDGGGGVSSTAFFGQGTTTVENSTISGNTTTGRGGGLRLQDRDVLISNSTITGNTTGGNDTGGGIQQQGFGLPIRIENSIVAFNSGLDCFDFFGDIVNAGFNFDSDGTCGGTTVDAATLNLQALADNGGATLTHALGAGSSAINQSNAPCPTVIDDQRGASRDPFCDSGSYEAGPVLPFLSFAAAASEADEGDGIVLIDISLDNTAGTLAGQDVRVFVSLRGAAARRFDYTLLNALPPDVDEPFVAIDFTVPNPGSIATQSLQLGLIDDAIEEGDENVEIRLGFLGPAQYGANPAHSLLILDNDAPVGGACRELQLRVQSEVGDEDARYRNHGQYIKAVTRIVTRQRDKATKQGGCRGCIISQFARGVPVAEQLACPGR